MTPFDVSKPLSCVQVRPRSGVLCDVDVPSLPFSALSPGRLATLQVRSVLAWLFAADHDGLEVAERLGEAGFAGKLTLVSGPLPRPNMVLREIVRLCPMVTVRLEQRTANCYEAAVAAATAVENTAIRA